MEKRRPFQSADMTSYLLIIAILTWTAHQGVSGDQTACSRSTRCSTNWIRAFYPSHNSNLPNQQLQASAVQGYGLKKKIKHKKAPDTIIKDTEAISDGLRLRPSSLHRRHHRLLLDGSGQPPLYYLKRRKLHEAAIKSRRRGILQARARAVQVTSKTLTNATVGDQITAIAAETPRRRVKPSKFRTTVRPRVSAGRNDTPLGVEDIRNQLELLSKHGFSDVGSESVSRSATSIWSHPEDRNYRANKLRKRRKLMALRQESKHNRFYTNLSAAKREQALEGTRRSANRIVKTVPERGTRHGLRRKLSQIKFPGEKFTIKKKIPDVKDNRLDRVEFPVKKGVVVKKKLIKSSVATNTSSVADPSTEGKPGVDYPIYSTIPDTTFRCSSQRYWGMYADTDTQCQVWHYCDRDGSRHSFLCPNGTVFSQVTFICDWWYNVDCNTASQLYVTNEALSLLPAPPDRTFPEDFNGPIVDWYIFQRHQEKAYRKSKFLKLISEGVKQKSIRFLDTHDLPPWFSDRDRKLYTKLKELERMSKLHMRKQKHQPVKKALNTYSPRLR